MQLSLRREPPDMMVQRQAPQVVDISGLILLQPESIVGAMMQNPF